MPLSWAAAAVAIPFPEPPPALAPRFPSSSCPFPPCPPIVPVFPAPFLCPITTCCPPGALCVLTAFYPRPGLQASGVRSAVVGAPPWGQGAGPC